MGGGACIHGPPDISEEGPGQAIRRIGELVSAEMVEIRLALRFGVVV
jgi:hypothetical protein